MEKLYCSSCKPRPLLEDGKDKGKKIFACLVRTETGFTYEDFYLQPKELGFYTPHVIVRKYDFNGRKRFVPVARLGEFLGLVVSEGQDTTPISD